MVLGIANESCSCWLHTFFDQSIQSLISVGKSIFPSNGLAINQNASTIITALNNTSSTIALIRSGIVDFVIIIISIFSIVLLMLLIRWLFGKEEFLVLPFETSGKDNEINGKAIADQLVHELRRIKQIHSRQFERYPALERLPLPSETVSCEKLNEALENLDAGSRSISQAVSDVGSVTVSGMSLPLGSVLITIKRIIHKGSGRDLISGSLQKLDKKFCLIAHVHHKGKFHAIEAGIDEDGGDIHKMVHNLAYKIYFTLSTEEIKQDIDNLPQSFDREEIKETNYPQMMGKQPRNIHPGLISTVDKILKPDDDWRARLMSEELLLIGRFGVLPLLFDRNKFRSNYEQQPSLNSLRAKSWKSLQYLTEALYHYDEYIHTQQPDALLEAKNNSQKAFEEDRNYGILFGILYNIAIAHFYAGEYDESLNLFDQANRIRAHAGALCGQGISLRYLQRFDEALDIFHKAMYEDPDLPIPWAGIAATYMDLGCYASDLYDRALVGFNEAIKRYPEYPYAWMYMGVVLSRKGYSLDEKDPDRQNFFDAAIKCLERANDFARQEGLKRYEFKSVGLAACYKWKGDGQRAAEIMSMITPDRVDTYNLACARSISDDEEEALKLAKQALRENKTSKVEILFDPDFSFGGEKLRKDLDKERNNPKVVKSVVKALSKEDDPYIQASVRAVTAEGTYEKSCAWELLKQAVLVDHSNLEKAKNDLHFWDEEDFYKKRLEENFEK